MTGMSFGRRNLTGVVFAAPKDQGHGAVPVIPSPDAIMNATKQFKADPRVDGVTKLNLGIGVCQNSTGVSEVPEFVQSIIDSPTFLTQLKRAEYLPGVGNAKFLALAQEQIFGESVDTSLVGSVQSMGGTNALYLILSALNDAQYDGNPNPYHAATVYVSNPTWGNHKLIPQEAGFGPRGIDPKKNPHVQEYPYMNAQGTGVDFDALLEFVKSREETSVFVLHASCHNPSGRDLTKEQWDTLIETIKAKQEAGVKITPLFDCAYQGFGQGFQDDVYAIRKAHESGITAFVAESYSKKLSLYGHRLGAAHIFSSDPQEVAAFTSIMANVSQRGTGSSCPLSGSVIAQMVLESSSNMEAYAQEMSKKRAQFTSTRRALGEAVGMDFSDTNGMFVLIPVQDDTPGKILWEKFGLMTVPQTWKDAEGNAKSAIRVCLDPINEGNLSWVVEGFKEAFGQVA